MDKYVYKIICPHCSQYYYMDIDELPSIKEMEDWGSGIQNCWTCNHFLPLNSSTVSIVSESQS